MRRSLLDWVLGYEPDKPLPVLFTDCCEDCGWHEYELHDSDGEQCPYCPKCGADLEVLPKSMWDERQVERAECRRLWLEIQETRRRTGIFCGHINGGADIHVSSAVDKNRIHYLPDSAAAGQTQQSVE